MTGERPDVSRRAQAIAAGLVQTRRASALRRTGAYLQLRATAGGYYWVAVHGDRLLRGDALDIADELQPSFADAMAKAGGGIS
jgi:hypothetical protein